MILYSTFYTLNILVQINKFLQVQWEFIYIHADSHTEKNVWMNFIFRVLNQASIDLCNFNITYFLLICQNSGWWKLENNFHIIRIEMAFKFLGKNKLSMRSKNRSDWQVNQKSSISIRPCIPKKYITFINT